MTQEIKKSWLSEHLNTFVRPYLGFVPTYAEANYFSPGEKAVIKNIWRSVKKRAEGRLLVLPGRDVFVWEVLARRENYPTLFLPEVSRLTADHAKHLIPDNAFVFDTGFAGSIPAALKVPKFSLMSYGLNRGECFQNEPIQTFPRMTGSRHLALKIEGTPKYWITAHMVDGKIVQTPSHRDEFEKAVQLTYEIYTDSSPKFAERIKKGSIYDWY